MKSEEKPDHKIELKPLKVELKNKLYEWFEFNTTHGMPNLARNRNPIVKIVWLVCLLASSAYCFYTITMLFISYLKYEVLINIQLVETLPVEFPAVTVCNLNPLDRRYSTNYINSVLAANNKSYWSNVSLIDVNPNQVKYLVKSAMAGDKNLTWEQKKNFGFDINFMFLTCSFNGESCNSSDFVWMYDFDYGNCYTFNSGHDQYGNKVKVRQMNEAGSDRSFRLELYLGDEYTQGIYMSNSGARVAVHNQSTYPLMGSEGKDLATNYETDMGITRSFVKKLSSPYSDCIEDNDSPNGYKSTYYKAMFSVLNVTTYRQVHCLKLCLQSYVLKRCSCLDAGLPNIYSNESYCDNYDKVQCAEDAREDYVLDSAAQSCKDPVLGIDSCPLECESTEYFITYTRSRYPTSYYTSYLRYRTDLLSRFPPNTVYNENYIQKNVVLLNVFYMDLATTNIDEVPKVTSDALFGDIGGNLGLFIGMSLLSFVEFIEIAIEVVLISIRNVGLRKSLESKKDVIASFDRI